MSSKMNIWAKNSKVNTDSSVIKEREVIFTFLYFFLLDDKLLNESIDNGGSSTFKFNFNETQSKIE